MVITKYYCDVCGKEDPNVLAWSLAPTLVRGSEKRIDFAVCEGCLPKVKSAVTGLLKHVGVEGT
jgi:hypothetical protein